MIRPANGWVEDQPDHIYHAGAGISSTQLKDLLRSPMHFKNRKYKDAAHFALGRAIHAAVLLPKVFEEQCKVIPDVNARTKAGREERDSFLAACGPDDIVLKNAAEAAQVKAIQESVMSSFGYLFQNGRPEISGYFHSQDFECLLKIRPDYLNERESAVIDLKSCVDASEKGVMSAVRRYKYHLSAAYYLDVAQELDADVLDFVWVFVEKDPPYACAAYRATEVTLMLGREMYRDALGRYHKCLNTDVWPGYTNEIQQLDLAP
jgi:hypothetical protein